MMPTSLVAVYFRGVTVSLASRMSVSSQMTQTVHDQNRLPTEYSVTQYTNYAKAFFTPKMS